MFINGGYRIVYLKLDDEYLPVGCLTSDSFNESVEMLDTTTRDNGGWKTSVPTTQSYNISFEGLVKQTLFDGQNDDFITLKRLKSLKRDKTLLEWKIESSIDINISNGKGYLVSLSETSNVDEFTTFNAEIQGYGNITETTKEIEFLQSSLQTQI